MIQISEPLADSKEGLTTTHDVLLDDKRIGYVNVYYIKQEEVKDFRKYTKRKLLVGQPYRVQLFIDAIRGSSNAKSLGKEGLREIVLALMGRFKGLEERDIYILELNSGGKAVIGRGSQL